MRVLVGQGKVTDSSILEKFDHLSLYYLYHFLSKKLKKTSFDLKIKSQDKSLLIEEVRKLTVEYS